MITKIKDFDLTYGWVVRWVLMLIVAYAILFMDHTYLRRSEVDQYMQKFHEMRKEDMSQIYNRIETVRNEARTSDAVVRQLEGKIERIAAQNEIIMHRLNQFTQ